MRMEDIAPQVDPESPTNSHARWRLTVAMEVGDTRPGFPSTTKMSNEGGVRFGSLADVTGPGRVVRFVPQADIPVFW